MIGVDDWALRKGAVYGTLLVDLERHRPLDLLPDRTSASLAAWLKQYPGIEIITRDRAGAYAEGARLGAPQALQIADRWHLLKNLQTCLVACFGGFQLPLHPKAVQPADVPLPSSSATDRPVRRSRAHPPHPLTQVRQQRRAHWQGIFEQVHHLAAAGSSNRAMARQLHISLKTVRKYRRLPALPRKTSPNTAPHLLDAYQPYLRQRLLVENISARQMWEELRAQGFRGGQMAVYLGVAQLRRELGLLPFRRHSTSPQPARLNCALIPRTLAAWVLRDATHCTVAETAAIQQASLLHPDLATAIFLGAAFADHLRHRNAPALHDWLRQAIASGIDSLMAFTLCCCVCRFQP